MAGPLGAMAVSAAKAVAKKITVDLFTEPEKVIKVIAIGLCVVLVIALLFIMPIYLLTNLPSILITSGTNSIQNSIQYDKQLKLIGKYFDAPIAANAKGVKWVEDKKVEYSGADDIRTDYEFTLTWQELMAIDAVRYNQYFSKVKEDDIRKLAESFLATNAYTESYTAEEKYTETEEYTVNENITDPKTGKVTSTPVKKTRSVEKTRTVTKTRAIITVGTVPFSDMLGLLNFNEEDKFAASQILVNIKGMDVEGNFNIYDDVDLSDLKEYPAGSAALPYFNQTDIRWGAEKYGLTGTIKYSGCGPTALAMVISGLTGRTDINPKVIADWSYNNGHRAEGQGSYWSLMTDGGSAFNLNVTAISRKNPDKILAALSEGKPVIVSMGPGNFTKSGHFIVLYGLKEKNKILVHDPVSVKRSNKEWDFKTILKESSKNGGEEGSPFWAFSLKED